MEIFWWQRHITPGVIVELVIPACSIRLQAEVVSCPTVTCRILELTILVSVVCLTTHEHSFLGCNTCLMLTWLWPWECLLVVLHFRSRKQLDEISLHEQFIGYLSHTLLIHQLAKAISDDVWLLRSQIRVTKSYYLVSWLFFKTVSLIYCVLRKFSFGGKKNGHMPYDINWKFTEVYFTYHIWQMSCTHHKKILPEDKLLYVHILTNCSEAS